MEEICIKTPLSLNNEIKTINDHSQRLSLIRPKLPHPNISNQIAQLIGLILNELSQIDK